MSNWRISRRMFMASTGAAFMLPLLESLSDRRAVASGASDPKRFVCFYMPHGTYNIPNDYVWYPNDGAMGTSNTSDVLSPFVANAGDFSVLKFLGISAGYTTFQQFSPSYPIDLHQNWPMSYLTGQVIAGTIGGSMPNWDYSTSYVPGTSFDQLYAQTSGKPALTLAGNVSPEFTYRTISYLNNKQLTPITDPGYLYKNMFASLVPSKTPAPQTALLRNKSILDGAVADLGNLRDKLGNSDQGRLDDYLTSLRDLETTLASQSQSSGATCQPIAAPSSSLSVTDTYGVTDELPGRVRAFMDMIVLAFKCDMVRSVSLMMSAEYGWNGTANQIPTTDLIYPGASLDKISNVGSDHMYAHYQEHDMGRAEMITRDRFRMSLITYLINGLKGATDPSGATILDNSIVLAGYGVEDGEHGNGTVHADARPTLVAGGAKLGLSPGRAIDATGYDMKDLLYTFNTALGMGLSNFVGNSKKVGI